LTKVDLPLPDFPVIPIISPLLTSKDKLSNIYFPSLPLSYGSYLKLIFLNDILGGYYSTSSLSSYSCS